ncbi:7666_t:CDS:2 [Funneliformis mosseae]|uniref:7666_t:CDS:1 n=1 Tax=Funneliformis mosseae TaxID=27381 RepID=A0A9N8V8Z9_FUNMO|nr:7666_t:CDS:2 [Funneliformis mosseae]
MNKYNSGEDRNHWKDWKKEKSKNQIVSDAIETNVKMHEKFNSTFDESGGSSLQKPLRLKRKLKEIRRPSDYDGLALLFEESKEDMIIRNIDEETLKEESKLPLATTLGRLDISTITRSISA